MTPEDAVARIEALSHELRDASLALAREGDGGITGALADRLGTAVNAIKASLDVIRARTGADDAIADE